MDTTTETELFLKSLSPKEHKAYLIAADHLGSSFTLDKSHAFLTWQQECRIQKEIVVDKK